MVVILPAEDLDGIAEAAARTQRLEELVIEDFESDDDSSELTVTEFVSLLSTTTSLKKLELNGCRIGDPGAEAFAHRFKQSDNVGVFVIGML